MRGHRTEVPFPPARGVLLEPPAAQKASVLGPFDCTFAEGVAIMPVVNQTVTLDNQATQATNPAGGA